MRFFFLSFSLSVSLSLSFLSFFVVFLYFFFISFSLSYAWGISMPDFGRGLRSTIFVVDFFLLHTFAVQHF